GLKRHRAGTVGSGKEIRGHPPADTERVIEVACTEQRALFQSFQPEPGGRRQTAVARHGCLLRAKEVVTGYSGNQISSTNQRRATSSASYSSSWLAKASRFRRACGSLSPSRARQTLVFKQSAWRANSSILAICSSKSTRSCSERTRSAPSVSARSSVS